MHIVSQPLMIHHYINGQIITGTGEHFYALHNPATGHLEKHVNFAEKQEVDRAVASAKAAFPAWSATPAMQRAQVLFRFKTLIEAHMDELAALITAEHGKTLTDAKGSIIRGIEALEVACGIPHLLRGTISENVGRDIDC